MLESELPKALGPTLDKQRGDVQAMLDTTAQRLKGDLEEARQASRRADVSGEGALAEQLKLAVGKFEALEQQMSDKMQEMAQATPTSPSAQKKYCDEKVAELAEKFASTPLRQYPWCKHSRCDV